MKIVTGNRSSAYKTIISTLGAVLLGVLSLADDDPADDFRILVLGSFHGSDVGPIDSAGWHGLFETDSGYVFKPVEIQAKPCYDPFVDEPGETTGISISVDQPLQPMFLVQSPRVLETGIVPTIFSGNKPIEPGAVTCIGFEHPGDYCITALGRVTDEEQRHPGDLLILDYQIKLFKYPYTTVESRQIIVEYKRSVFESLPALLWAGDLDRDGELDLFMDIRNHYGVRHYALFLSSEADTNSLIRLVAELLLRSC